WSAIPIVTPNSALFCPGAVVPLSIDTMATTLSSSTADAPDPTSSVMVKMKWTSTGVGTFASTIAFSAARAGAAGFVVEMAGDDIAVVEHLGARIDRDEIADVDAERLG